MNAKTKLLALIELEKAYAKLLKTINRRNFLEAASYSKNEKSNYAKQMANLGTCVLKKKFPKRLTELTNHFS